MESAPLKTLLPTYRTSHGTAIFELVGQEYQSHPVGRQVHSDSRFVPNALRK